MVYVDHTSDFRTLCPVSESSSSRSSSPGGTQSRTRLRNPKSRKDREAVKQEEEEREFLKEAYRIYSHLAALSLHLTQIRKPYLSLADPPLSKRRREDNVGKNGLNGSLKGGDGVDDVEGRDGGFEKWEGSNYLSDREREEIDLNGKLILRRCRERVGMLEEGEKARQKKVIPTQSTLYSFLPSLAPSPSNPIDALITAHRATVIWTLTSLLAKTSAQVSDLQEERSKRRAERGRTLGEGAEKEAKMLEKRNANPISKALSSLTGDSGSSSSSSFSTSGYPSLNGGLPDQAIIENQLTPQQIQQFESENNALLTHLESTLSTVLSAEKSLTEISELQTQLIQHLVQQTEMVDMLYEQAVGSVAQVKGAEQQLKKAKERSGEARLFLVLFLIGASLGLLFLDWYS